MSDATIARLEAEVDSLTSKIASLKAEHQKELADAKAEVGREKAGRHLAVAAMAAGVAPEALTDLMNRANAAGWTTDETNTPVLWDKQRDKPVFNSSTLDPITPEEWIKEQRKTAPHLFSAIPENRPPVYGNGSDHPRSQNGGNGGGFDLSGRNPWSKEHWDDTAQARAYLDSPEKAKALAAAAGSRIGALRPA